LQQGNVDARFGVEQQSKIVDGAARHPLLDLDPFGAQDFDVSLRVAVIDA
jgi:hypothetical protein